MPILLPEPVRRLGQQEFHELDYRVMGVAFAVHNDLGRHVDEEIYESELTYRLRCEGIAVCRQFPIRLVFGDYQATLKADLLVAGSTIYEIKAVPMLAPAHRAQALGYVLLSETHHGKLVNFGTMKVASEFVSTTLSLPDRRQITASSDRWRDLGAASRQAKSVILDVVHDWGLCLESSLYRHAIVHLLGGSARVRSTIELLLGERKIGSKEVDLIDPDTLLVISTLGDDLEPAERHYQRLLVLSQRRFLQWVNLRKHQLEFITLVNTV